MNNNGKELLGTLLAFCAAGLLGVGALLGLFLLAVALFLFKVALASLFWYIVFWALGISGSVALGASPIPYYVIAGLISAFLSGIVSKLTAKVSK